MSRRKSSVTDKPLIQDELLQAEIDKFVYVRDTIDDWLKAANSYSELDWQRMIIKVILLIFPKYIAVLENVEIADFYTTPGRTRRRFIDLCLVDAGGNIDVIEIKKPFDNVVVTKTLYRDNSLPTRELSGSIMQAEKYLFHLSKWGVPGERELTDRYGPSLPGSLSIRVTNPKAMIILGRDRLPNGQPALSDRQMFDFEVIKRKYANMIDILTYDDLLRRLNNIIASLSRRKAESLAVLP
nr:Shedu immune nuclease family protein [Sphingomonas hankyongi]